MSRSEAWFAISRALVDSILDAEDASSRLDLDWGVDGDNGAQVHAALWHAQTVFVSGDLHTSKAAIRELLGIAERVPADEEAFRSPVPHLDALRGLILLAPRES